MTAETLRAIVSLIPLFVAWVRAAAARDDDELRRLQVKAYRAAKRRGVQALFGERDQ